MDVLELAGQSPSKRRRIDSDSESTEALGQELSDEMAERASLSPPNPPKAPENTPTPMEKEAGACSTVTAGQPTDGISTVETGEPNTASYAVKFQQNGKDISPWHDIPLYADKAQKHVNFICEIPKNTAKKFEISRTIVGNPIVQDKNGDGNLREDQWPTKEVDPLGPRMMWNYGALPQTWEDPRHSEVEISIDGKHPRGDNDPIDAIELGSNPCQTGEIAAVKVLGVLALVDSGETDWKLLVVRVDNPDFKGINTLAELKKSPYSGEITAIHDWLKNYKLPTKQKLNNFGFNGEAKDEIYAMSKVEQTHGFWAKNTNSGTENRELDS